MKKKSTNLSRFGHALVVMGDNSCSRGNGFESQCQILDGHFFALIFCKKYIVCLKRPKINDKEARVGPFNFFAQNQLIVTYRIGLIIP